MLRRCLASKRLDPGPTMAEGGGTIVAAVVAICLVFSFIDYIGPSDASQKEQGEETLPSEGKTIPKLRMEVAGSPEVPQLTFLYCVS